MISKKQYFELMMIFLVTTFCILFSDCDSNTNIDSASFFSCKSNLQRLLGFIETYKREKGQYPDSLQTLIKPTDNMGPFYCVRSYWEDQKKVLFNYYPPPENAKNNFIILKTPFPNYTKDGETGGEKGFLAITLGKQIKFITPQGVGEQRVPSAEK